MMDSFFTLEYEIRAVGGIESCFVSLPLPLIQALQQSTPSGMLLPGLLPMELRHLPSGDSWAVAWSGDVSNSGSAIEISQQFAQCISLPDHIKVQVRVVSNLPKATLVTVEPLTEDDWEVLELNSEAAEAAILKQIQVVHETMNFPLWLHGHAIIKFRVVSTFPEKTLVQLVPGTEVAVAPKRRLQRSNTEQDTTEHSSEEIKKALLRVQDPNDALTRKVEINSLALSISLTAVAYVHPETAKHFGFGSHCSVVVLPSTTKGLKSKLIKNQLKVKSETGPKEGSTGSLAAKKVERYYIVSLLMSDAVVEGHIMISWPVCMYLGIGPHSWVHVKTYNRRVIKDSSSLTMSPIYLKLLGKDKNNGENGESMLDFRGNQRKQNGNSKHDEDVIRDVEDWSTHVNFINALSDQHYMKDDDASDDQSRAVVGLLAILRAWYLAHTNTFNLDCWKEIKSLALGGESVVHFEIDRCQFRSSGKFQLSNGSMERNTRTEDQTFQIFFLLSPCVPTNDKFAAYELAFNGGKGDRCEDMELQNRKVVLGHPATLHYSTLKQAEKEPFSDLSSLSWMEAAASDIVNRLMVLLSSTAGKWFSLHDLPVPGHVLIHGPAGSGKSLLARAVAKHFEQHVDILAHVDYISCSQFALEKNSSIRQKISNYMSDALDHAPSVVVFDDLDSIVALPSDSEGPVSSSSSMELTEFLEEIIDEYAEKRKSKCGIGPIAFLATIKSLDKIPQSLSSSGRFDFHVQLPAPAASEREAMLKHEMQRRSLNCADEILQDVAFKCDGYDAYDLEILVDRAIHASVVRLMPSSERCDKITLVKDDFSRAMDNFLPVSMRDVTKIAPKSGHSGWEDIGGLLDVRNAIKEMIELPSKFPNVFGKAPLRLRSNVLLYGPPGCGKTHIVGAAAASFSLRFISVKGPELLNKYIGASEQAVRDVFSKAAAAAPCLLFFDEFDSIAPKRGHDNTGVTDRVVNQFLTELDGVEVLTGVFVFAATSRPDLLDAALLRPGRLDRLLFCDFPSKQERLDILKVLSRKLPLEDDVDLDAVANTTDGFSGADLQALLSDAQLEAVHVLLDNQSTEQSNQPGKTPVITNDLLLSVASKARPSVTDAEKKRLYGIYSQFLDSKRSMAAQSRDANGKRATLA
ncbi:hypothetical protein MLD38_037294 [Melastoma candidum]|uniref:Uncharacterized protein n=1 Tax=Melastoma candidum TaxID=119954 RepID=A0ACB9LNC9_9MYRT|nr:hypothetical protein MLD38_037294 [Melastoma candidum]